MIENLIKLIQEKSPGSVPLFLVIRGSHAYGTNIDTSDVDYAGVFIQPLYDIMIGNYKEQINDNKNDIVIYEIRRFMDLLESNNPTILELLNTPDDCIIYKDPIFDIVLDNRNSFISKICAKSFGGYAIQQIKKAKGQNKMQNWEKDKITRKGPIDFCYLLKGEKSIPLVEYLESNNIDQRHCGLANVPHSRDIYALFFDNSGSLGFKGIAFEKSNELRLSSIPTVNNSAFSNNTSHYFLGHISYNKDGYTKHCKEYKSYQDWLSKRNLSRWTDVKNHDKKIDGKNMMHCIRLIEMCKDIVEGKGIIVRRENAKDLLAIRKGEVDLQSIIDNVELNISYIEEAFRSSNLPDKVDKNITDNIVLEIRKKIYNLK